MAGASVTRQLTRTALARRPSRSSGSALVVLGLVLTFARPRASGGPRRPRRRRRRRRSAALPPVRHVFVINIENKGFRHDLGRRSSQAPYLAKTLRPTGCPALASYYGTAHHSLGNYLAQISGPGPRPRHPARLPDVHRASASTGADARPGQVVGNGCVYPATVKTLADQLQAAGLVVARLHAGHEARPCQHPRPRRTPTRGPERPSGSQYATRHNPFVYFRSITGHPSYCKTHVVGAAALTTDLRHSQHHPRADLHHARPVPRRHDAVCADGGPGGLRAANGWLQARGCRGSCTRRPSARTACW